MYIRKYFAKGTYIAMNCYMGKCNLHSLFKAIPTSRPSMSYYYSISGYEGDTMKFVCYLSSLGDPPIIWSWFCGEEQILSDITNSTTNTFLTFPLLLKYHQRACYCRATSPSTLLVYNETSSNRYILDVYRKCESLSSVIYLDITVRKL